VITNVAKIVVPVEDPGSARDFWTKVAGFHLVRDETYGDERWIEVKPARQDLLLILSQRQPGEPRRSVPDDLPHSDLFFNCTDVVRTYEDLTARGVEFPLPPRQEHFGWWALFADGDGTRYALGQWDGSGS
jgi:predicted enzyme related to lactoylglutathione lyase